MLCREPACPVAQTFELSDFVPQTKLQRLRFPKTADLAGLTSTSYVQAHQDCPEGDRWPMVYDHHF